MPDTQLLLRASVPARDLTEDPFSNNFVFQAFAATTFTTATFTALEAAVVSFYNTIATGAVNAIGTYMGNQLNNATNSGTITTYDITGHLDGTPHGSPVHSATWTLIAPSPTAALPMGCAASVGYRADYGTDVEFGPGTPATRPRARDRARIYIGPLNGLATSTDAVTNRVLLAPVFLQSATHQLKALSQPITVESNTWQLGIWSRVGARVKPSFQIFMDNRIDYQRRRSDAAPATRVTLAV